MADTQDESSGSDDGRDQDPLLQSGSTFAATAFDHYFLLASKRSRTSSNVFSARVDPLTPQQFTAALSYLPSVAQIPPLSYNALFPRFLLQLEQGFNLLFYGAGSKRNALNDFVEYIHKRRKVHIVIANAFNPNFTLKDLLTSAETVLDTSTVPASLTQRGNTPEIQLARIQHVLSTSSRKLCIVIHNIDSPPLTTTKSKSILSTLACNPNVHLVASVDNIAFPLLWSHSDAFHRHHPSPSSNPPVSHSQHPSPTSPSPKSSESGFGWLYHSLPTLQPYDFELSSADRSSISGASRLQSKAARLRAAGGGGGAIPAIMTEVAARHILVSVTAKAKRLFVLLAKRQLEAMAANDKDGSGDNASAQDMQNVAVEQGTLYEMARMEFIATSDPAFRALMGEFKDHGLMLTAAQGNAGDVVWIPLRTTVLTTLIEDIQQERL